MSDLQRLLVVQDHDLSLDQLRHRRETLPARAPLAEHRSTVARTDAELTEVRSRLHEIELAQRKLEDEVTRLDDKIAIEDKKLNSGSITSPRELQALSDEIESLGRRKRALEDDELELMERAEPLSAEVERLQRERGAAASEVERFEAEVDTGEREIDAELASVSAAREAAAKEIPPALMDRYEKLRTKLGGVAVARLEGDRCTGCHVTLPAVEVDVIRHGDPDAVVTHEDCGRILVR